MKKNIETKTKLNIDNGLSNIKCKCGHSFSVTENQIEEQIIQIPYTEGIKGFFGMTKELIYNRYVTCPECYRKMKLKFYVEDYKVGEFKYE